METGVTLSVTDRDAVGRTLRPEPGKTISRRRIVGVVVGATVGLDQVTKLVALRRLSPTAIHIWGDLVRLQLSDNAGAFLGLGAKLSPIAAVLGIHGGIRGDGALGTGLRAPH